MYLSRITPAGTINMASGDEYAVHQAVWKAFSDRPERKRDFLYRLEGSTSGPVVYAVSQRPPIENTNWDMKTKRFKPVLEPTEAVRFTLRSNPVVSRSMGRNGRSKRHDVVRDLKKQVESPAAVPAEFLLRRAGLRWLRKRAEKSGFTFDEEHIQVGGYRKHTLTKPGARSPIRFSSIDFNGRLVVQDPGRFLDALTWGHGPAKGFGMGLMLIRRALPPVPYTSVWGLGSASAPQDLGT